MMFALGVIVGIGLSGIALYAATHPFKPLSDLFTVNPISTTQTMPDRSQMAQIIRMTDPTKQFTENE